MSQLLFDVFSACGAQRSEETIYDDNDREEPVMKWSQVKQSDQSYQMVWTLIKWSRRGRGRGKAEKSVGCKISKMEATKYGDKLLNCAFAACAGQLQDQRPL